MAARMPDMTSRLFVLLGVIFLDGLCATSPSAQGWQVVASGADTNLRAISATSSDRTAPGKAVVWAAGSNGAVLISHDEGKHWERLSVKGGEQLDFRGVVAFDATRAYLMASGEGEKSRIYKTTDGGAAWQLQYSDTRKEFFLDAIACLSERECYALGDPIAGKFVILRTQDGARWMPLPTEVMPPALPREGAFAAGNSCLAVNRTGDIYFVTGGPTARVFHSPDAGRTWKATKIPLAKGNESSGAFSIAVDGKRIVAVGGNYRVPGNPSGTAAYSNDAGVTWHAAQGSPGGFRSAVTIFDRELSVAVGTNGSDVSTDSGAHWKHADPIALNALTPDSAHGMWGAGPKGTVARFHKLAEHKSQTVRRRNRTRRGANQGESCTMKLPHLSRRTHDSSRRNVRDF
jgi:photosystem II stability/assembly factor-like uncharacterized protein